ISTKILLKHISPTEILFYRYMIAYLLFFAASPRIMWPLSLRDEIKFAFAGFLGVTLYFLCENFALSFSSVSNVSLLVATAPLLTGIVSHFLTKSEKITVNFIYGCIFGLAGVFLIVFNGRFVLRINPFGDILAIMAALSFAFYSIIIRDLNRAVYSAAVITRKTFFYSLISLIPLLFTPLFEWDPGVLIKKEVFGNLIFLGVFASALCFLLWNKVIWDLGAVKANNLIYLTPPIAMLTAAVVLHEKITLFSAVGGLLILLGVYLSQKRIPNTEEGSGTTEKANNTAI
ncbi:MAG: DMT family transporter, partial [Synergistaceae bacterium]|nr:DMT family transporter [Synergistaceae bacterium]